MATVEPFDPTLHAEGSVSREGHCGQGGRDYCDQPAVFSVVGDDFRIAACDTHVAGALRQALGLPAKG